MADATTPAKGLILPTVGGDNNIWGSVLNSTIALIDSALGGTVAFGILGNITLTTTQLQNTGFHFTGTAVATVLFPDFQGLAVIRNSSTQVITCGITGADVPIPAGQTMALWSDGSVFIAISASIVGTSGGGGGYGILVNGDLPIGIITDSSGVPIYVLLF